MWPASSSTICTYLHSLDTWRGGGNYTGAYRNITSIQATLHQNECPQDVYASVTRILQTCCPYVFRSNSSRENFLKYKTYGNHTSIIRNTKKVEQAMNKNNNHCFFFCFQSILPTSFQIYT